MWNIYKINYAYYFKWNKVYNNTITINRKCNCSSIISGVINNFNFENYNIMMCERTKGTGTCGKRILRNPERAQIDKILWGRLSKYRWICSKILERYSDIYSHRCVDM